MNNNQTDPRWRYIVLLSLSLSSFVRFHERAEEKSHGGEPHDKKHQNKKNNVSFVPHLVLFYYCNSFTDLSAAGLPAELKHITQRRKRKQP